jgi:hypothetical protein
MYVMQGDVVIATNDSVGADEEYVLTIFTSPTEIIVWKGNNLLIRTNVDLYYNNTLEISGRNVEATFDNIESKFDRVVYFQDQNEYPNFNESEGSSEPESELPKESEKVRVFRKGLEKFYENLEIHPKDLIQFLWDYEFEYSNYHIEVPVAAYKLYLASKEMSQENIYACAKIRMRVNDAYYAISRKKNATSWRIGKASNIKRFHTYLDRLCDLRIKRFFLEKEWVRFLSSKEKYEYIELPWLKLIYLVENFYC